MPLRRSAPANARKRWPFVGDRILAVGTRDEVMKMQGPGDEDCRSRRALRHARIQRCPHAPGQRRAGEDEREHGRRRRRSTNSAIVCAQSRDTAAPGEWIIGEGWDETLWPVKLCPRAGILTKSAADIRFTSPAWTDTSAWPTRAPCNWPASPSPDEDPRWRQDRPRRVWHAQRHSPREGARAGAGRDSEAHAREATASHRTRSRRYGQPRRSPPRRIFRQWEDFQIYEELEREGKLTARISEWLPFDESLEDLNSKRNSHPASDTMLHTGMLKGFMDGSLGSKTAALLEPYSDDPKNTGIPQYEPAKLNAMTRSACWRDFRSASMPSEIKACRWRSTLSPSAEKAAKEANVKAARRRRAIIACASNMRRSPRPSRFCASKNSR